MSYGKLTVQNGTSIVGISLAPCIAGKFAMESSLKFAAEELWVADASAVSMMTGLQSAFLGQLIQLSLLRREFSSQRHLVQPTFPNVVSRSGQN